MQKGAKENINVLKSERKDTLSVSTLQQQIDYYKKEKDILLDLSNDITKAREKDDLLTIFSSRLKQYFYFTHAAIALIDSKNGTYYPFLLDRESMPIKHRKELPSLLNMHFVIDDPFIGQVEDSKVSAAFLLDEIINELGIPAFLKVNYECGIRKAMVTKLKSRMETIGFVLMYSDRTDSFPEDFQHVIEGIAPHLSNAVTNIIINEEAVIKDRDKSFLIEFSHDIASARTKDELSKAIHHSLKKLGQISTYFIRTINDDGLTLSPFTHDKEVHYEDDPEFRKLLATKISKDEGITGRVLRGNEPVLIDFIEEIEQGTTDAYIEFWKSLSTKKRAFQKMVGIPLRIGNADLGVLWVITDEINLNLLEGISAQIAVAISNAKSNEEILEREKEKSVLLSLSSEIAALKSREDLFRVVNARIKALFAVSEFGIVQINEGDSTYGSFILDVSDDVKSASDFKEVASAKYAVTDPLFSGILSSEVPVMLDAYRLAGKPGMPSLVNFWKQARIRHVLAMRLRVGGKNVGCAYLHIDEAGTSLSKKNLFKAVCAHLSVAVSSILANEQIKKKQEEQAFLLDFSNDLAHVRTKDDLQAAIFRVVDNTLHTKVAMLRVIDEDGFHLSRFIYDSSLFANSKATFEKMAATAVTIEDAYTAEVLASEDGMMFNIEEELKTGNPYAKLWKTTGFKNVYGLPLRVGNKNIGTIWLLANQMSQLLLKGICSQISVTIANIQANEKLLAYKKKLEVENDYLKEQIKTIYNFSEIIGNGEAMQKVYRLMSLVADSNTTVLILGETGTGKELIARAIHNTSPRRDKLMVKVNCAALPANLIESELFGHERGAFTGAIDKRIGKFELANHSTLFLDEIGELPLEAQSKLLRVIQEGELERLGGTQTIKIDVRLVAATNRNLEEEVKAGRFRADLYFRLNVFPIPLPPLRDRPEDIEALAHFFIQKFSRNAGRKIRKISPKVIPQLRSYTWPGNVRELEHLIERSILMATDGILDEIHMPHIIETKMQGEAYLLNRSLEELERGYIIETLRRCAGKISGSGSAAEVLKVPGNTLHSKMKKLGISKSDYYNF